MEPEFGFEEGSCRVTAEQREVLRRRTENSHTKALQGEMDGDWEESAAFGNWEARRQQMPQVLVEQLLCAEVNFG